MLCEIAHHIARGHLPLYWTASESLHLSKYTHCGNAYGACVCEWYLSSVWWRVFTCLVGREKVPKRISWKPCESESLEPPEIVWIKRDTKHPSPLPWSKDISLFGILFYKVVHNPLDVDKRTFPCSIFGNQEGMYLKTFKGQCAAVFLKTYLLMTWSSPR